MIRLALIGCTADAGGYAAVTSRLQGAAFTAVADADLDRARRFAQEMGAPIWAAGLDALLAGHAGAFDAVVMHAPNHAHDGTVGKAAAAGKHLLVQEPPVSADAAAAVIAACRTADVRLMVGPATRFLPALQAVKQSLDAGQLGEPGLLRIHRWEPADDGPANGRSFLNKAVADIDLANWLFGRVPEVVYAVARSPNDSHAHADYVQLHLGFPEGGMALIDHAATLPGGAGYFSLSLIGARGAAYADDHHDMNLLYRGGPPAALTASQAPLHLLAQLQEFAAAIAAHREPAVSGADGRAAVLVAEAAAASLLSAQAVRLAEERG